MDNRAVVDRIMKNLDIDLETVPKHKTRRKSSTSSSKDDPLNVKIRVRKKDYVNESFTQGFISNDPSEPEMVLQKIRLVNSDETIMTFDMLMEAALDTKTSPKPRKMFSKLKPGLCLGAAEDDDGPYIPDSGYSDNVTDSNTVSNSDGLLRQQFPIAKNTFKTFVDSTLPRRERSFLGRRCKPGGCLDPPFGEDRYSYMPSAQKPSNARDVNTKRDIKSPATKSYIHRDMSLKPIDTTKQDSILHLYKLESPKNFIRTNPSDHDGKPRSPEITYDESKHQSLSESKYVLDDEGSILNLYKLESPKHFIRTNPSHHDGISLRPELINDKSNSPSSSEDRAKYVLDDKDSILNQYKLESPNNFIRTNPSYHDGKPLRHEITNDQSKNQSSSEDNSKYVLIDKDSILNPYKRESPTNFIRTNPSDHGGKSLGPEIIHDETKNQSSSEDKSKYLFNDKDSISNLYKKKSPLNPIITYPPDNDSKPRMANEENKNRSYSEDKPKHPSGDESKPLRYRSTNQDNENKSYSNRPSNISKNRHSVNESMNSFFSLPKGVKRESAQRNSLKRHSNIPVIKNKPVEHFKTPVSLDLTPLQQNTDNKQISDLHFKDNKVPEQLTKSVQDPKSVDNKQKMPLVIPLPIPFPLNSHRDDGGVPYNNISNPDSEIVHSKKDIIESLKIKDPTTSSSYTVPLENAITVNQKPKINDEDFQTSAQEFALEPLTRELNSPLPNKSPSLTHQTSNTSTEILVKMPNNDEINATSPKEYPSLTNQNSSIDYTNAEQLIKETNNKEIDPTLLAEYPSLTSKINSNNDYINAEQLHNKSDTKGVSSTSLKEYPYPYQVNNNSNFTNPAQSIKEQHNKNEIIQLLEQNGTVQGLIEQEQIKNNNEANLTINIPDPYVETGLSIPTANSSPKEETKDSVRNLVPVENILIENDNIKKNRDMFNITPETDQSILDTLKSNLDEDTKNKFMPIKPQYTKELDNNTGSKLTENVHNLVQNDDQEIEIGNKYVSEAVRPADNTLKHKSDIMNSQPFTSKVIEKPVQKKRRISIDKEFEHETESIRPLDISTIEPKLNVQWHEKLITNDNAENNICKIDVNTVSLDLAFHSYINNRNERILSTVDARYQVRRYPNDAFILINSQVKLSSNENYRQLNIPIDSKHDISISIKKTNDNNKANDIKYETKPIPKTLQIAKAQNSEAVTKGIIDQKVQNIERKDSYEACNTLTDIYEQELVPLQMMIRNLKQEIDSLAIQQALYKKKVVCLRKTRLPPIMHSNKRCTSYKP